MEMELDFEPELDDVEYDAQDVELDEKPPQDVEAVFVPYTALSDKALRGVVESYVLREGTDYGLKEFSLEEKVAHVMRQLQSGEAKISFDPVSQSIHIVRSS